MTGGLLLVGRLPPGARVLVACSWRALFVECRGGPWSAVGCCEKCRGNQRPARPRGAIGPEDRTRALWGRPAALQQRVAVIRLYAPPRPACPALPRQLAHPGRFPTPRTTRYRPAPVDPIDLSIVLGSALLHAGWSVAMKGSRNALVFNLMQTIVISGIALGVLATFDLGSLPGGFWPLLAETSVAHALYLYWLARALSDGDISLVYPIARSTPAFLPLIAVPLLGESISLFGAIGIVVVVAGIWLVNLHPGFQWRGLGAPGVGFALLTLGTTVAYSILDARTMVLLDGTPWTSPLPRPIFFFLMFYLASAVLFVPLVLLRTPRSEIASVVRAEWRQALFALVIGVAGYSLILQALRTAPVSYVVAVRQSSVFFVLVLGFVRLGERPGLPRVLGAGLTVAGVVLIGMAK